MGIRYCDSCERTITAKRKIGVGTLVMAFFTGGLWLLLIPLYPKRCPICLGTRLSFKAPVSPKQDG
jgi:hypothetical protein